MITKRTEKRTMLRLAAAAAAVFLIAALFVGAGAAAIAGSGTASDPYLITKGADMAEIAANPATYCAAGVYIRLDDDIVLPDGYQGIGTASNPFMGDFNGAGYSISGLIRDVSTGNIGVFAYVKDAKIHDLILKDLTVESDGGRVAGLISEINGEILADENDMLYKTPVSGNLIQNTENDAKSHYKTQIYGIKLQNVSISNLSNSGGSFFAFIVSYVSSGSVWIEDVTIDDKSKAKISQNCIGGIIGNANSGSSVAMVDCSMNAASIYSGTLIAGGIIGLAAGPSVYLHNVDVNSDSIISGGHAAGGLIAGLGASSRIVAIDCDVDVDMLASATYGSSGLISGTSSSSVQMQGCSVRANILSSYYAGGLFGQTNSMKFLNVTGCTVADSTIIAKDTLAGDKTVAGFNSKISLDAGGELIYSGNVLENVTVIVANPEFASLVDFGLNAQLLISSSAGIAPLKETVFGDIMTVRNSSVIKGGSSAKTLIDTDDYSNVKTKITSITVGDKVTAIGNGAFAGATVLTRFNGIDAVTTIGNSAFSGCTALGSTGESGFYIPSTVTSLGTAVFLGCSGLDVIYGPTALTDTVPASADYAVVGIDDLENVPNIYGKLVGDNVKAGTFVPNDEHKFEGITGKTDASKTGVFYLASDVSMTPLATYVANSKYLPVFHSEETNLLWKVVPYESAGIKWDADEYVWRVSAGSSVTLGVYLDTSDMINDKSSLRFTMYNFTYVTDFHNDSVKSDSVNLTFEDKDNWDLVYGEETALGTQSAEGFDQYAHQAGAVSAVSSVKVLSKSIPLVHIGNITITSTKLANRGIDKAYSITLQKSDTASGEGFATNTGAGIESGDFYASVMADYIFKFYIGDIEISGVSYDDGRYTFAQELNETGADKPLFYIYSDIYKGLFADSGKFTDITTAKKPEKFTDGYFWNTTKAAGFFAFEAAATEGGSNVTNAIKKDSLAVTDGVKKEISFAIGKGDPLTELAGSSRNATVIVESWLNKTTNNSMDGWYFDTPYNVTYTVRPGPYGYNETALAGGVEGVERTVANWDSGYKVADLENNAGKSVPVTWFFDEVENAAGNVYNSYASAAESKFAGKQVMDSTQNIEVVSSDSYEGDNVVFKLTGWKLADVNKNGKVNLQDAGRISFLAIAAADEGGDYDKAITAYYDAGYEHAILADCNKQGGDGVIDAADVKAVNSWLAGSPVW